MIKRIAQHYRSIALRSARWWEEHPYRMTALLAAGTGLRVYNAQLRFQQRQRVEKLEKLVDLSKRLDAKRRKAREEFHKQSESVRRPTIDATDVVSLAKRRWELARLAGQHVDENEGGHEPDRATFRAVASCAAIVPDLIKIIEGASKPEPKPVYRDKYRSPDGLVIALECPEPPMGAGSGYIPPPHIEFYRDGRLHKFIYQGPE